MAETKKPQRQCPLCEKTVTVNKDGTLQRHQGTEPHPLGHKSLTCLGGNG